MYVCTYVRMYVCMYVCMYVRMYVATSTNEITDPEMMDFHTTITTFFRS